jgi:GDP-4-dehydro-6-deoxy-D-mannose reductase
MSHELRKRGTRALVTGAGGFLGRSLTAALRAAGHHVTAVSRSDGDVSDPATWTRLPAVDHVFHLAARCRVTESWDEPAAFLQVNVVGTTRALEFCRATGAHLVFASTPVYGRPQRLPVHEDDPAEPNSPYGLSKLLAERACSFCAASMNLPVTVLRIFNLFGPFQSEAFLIPWIVRQALGEKTIRIKDLAPRRDFIFIDDVVAALVGAMADPAGHRVFNIGSGVSYSVQEVIDTIQDLAGTRLPVVSEGTPRPNEILDIYADITRARDVLGWTPAHTLAQGLERVVAAERSAPYRS